MDQGNGISIWQIVVSAAVLLGVALLAAFWSLADPRSDLKTIRETFLTIREHVEFRERTQHDIIRLELQIAKNAEAIEKMRQRETDTMIQQKMHP